jgi:hypothetical protein
MTHCWWWKTWLPERKGQPCRVVARAKPRDPRKRRSPLNVLVEFSDGVKVVATMRAIRRLP